MPETVVATAPNRDELIATASRLIVADPRKHEELYLTLTELVGRYHGGNTFISPEEVATSIVRTHLAGLNSLWQARFGALIADQVNRTVAIRDGRVSSEVLRQRRLSDAGDHHVIATEYAVLDRAGRLQLPRAQVEALHLERRVRLELQDDHIEIWPDQPGEAPGS